MFPNRGIRECRTTAGDDEAYAHGLRMVVETPEAESRSSCGDEADSRGLGGIETVKHPGFSDVGRSRYTAALQKSVRCVE